MKNTNRNPPLLVNVTDGIAANVVSEWLPQPEKLNNTYLHIPNVIRIFHGEGALKGVEPNPTVPPIVPPPPGPGISRWVLKAPFVEAFAVFFNSSYNSTTMGYAVTSGFSIEGQRSKADWLSGTFNVVVYAQPGPFYDPTKTLYNGPPGIGPYMYFGGYRYVLWYLVNNFGPVINPESDESPPYTYYTVGQTAVGTGSTQQGPRCCVPIGGGEFISEYPPSGAIDSDNDGTFDNPCEPCS